MTRRTFSPAYLASFESGELHQRVEQVLDALFDCTLCPRDCHVDRAADRFAVCKTGRYATVSSGFPHLGEEDCLRGVHGSGTIFFSWCNLRCVFYQNYDISWQGGGRVVSPGDLAAMMLELQAKGCHNINFVTPELGPNTYVNVMAQYHPAGKVLGDEYVNIGRRITRDEYEGAIAAALTAGLTRLDARSVAAVM